MNVYQINTTRTRRRYLYGGTHIASELKWCSSCNVSLTHLPSDYGKNVDLEEGSFVSNIFHAWQSKHVSEGLKDALQKKGFDGFEFEPTEIVADERPSGDKKKLPLVQIPQFYQCKLLTAIPLHQDFIELYDVRHCPECEGILSKHKIEPYILDKKHYPRTDFFAIDWKTDLTVDRLCAGGYFCTERGKTFLEKYPKTYCSFKQVELRD